MSGTGVKLERDGTGDKGPLQLLQKSALCSIQKSSPLHSTPLTCSGLNRKIRMIPDETTTRLILGLLCAVLQSADYFPHRLQVGPQILKAVFLFCVDLRVMELRESAQQSQLDLWHLFPEISSVVSVFAVSKNIK